jgi:hypothetical protein
VPEPSLDRTRLSGHQRHHSCALRKTGTEARKPGRSAHCERQSPGMDQRHQARPHSGTSRSGPRFFGVRSGEEPAPSLDMAEVSQRSATGSRSGDGSILTRRDAPPDFLASAIFARWMPSCVAVITLSAAVRGDVTVFLIGSLAARLSGGSHLTGVDASCMRHSGCRVTDPDRM